MQRKLSRIEWLFVLVPTGAIAMLCVWNFSSAFQQRFVRVKLEQSAPIQQLDFSSDGKRLLSVSSGLFVNSQHPDELTVLTAHGQSIWTALSSNSGFWSSACFSPDGSRVLALEYIISNAPLGVRLGGMRPSRRDGLTHIYDAKNGRELQSIPAMDSAYRFFLHDSKTVMSDGQTIRTRDLISGKTLHSFSFNRSDVYDNNSWAKSSKVFLANVGRPVPQTLMRGCILDLDTGRRVYFPQEAWSVQTSPQSLELSPNAKIVATASSASEHRIRLWDAATGKLLRVLPRSGASSLRFSRDSRTLASAEHIYAPESIQTLNFDVRGCRLQLFDVRSGSRRWWINTSIHGDYLLFSRDGRLVALCGASLPDDQHFRSRPIIELRDARNGDLLTTIPGSNAVFSPDGKTLAVSDDKTIRLHNIAGLARKAVS